MYWQWRRRQCNAEPGMQQKGSGINSGNTRAHRKAYRSIPVAKFADGIDIAGNCAWCLSWQGFRDAPR